MHPPVTDQPALFWRNQLTHTSDRLLLGDRDRVKLLVPRRRVAQPNGVDRASLDDPFDSLGCRSLEDVVVAVDVGVVCLSRVVRQHCRDSAKVDDSIERRLGSKEGFDGVPVGQIACDRGQLAWLSNSSRGR